MKALLTVLWCVVATALGYAAGAAYAWIARAAQDEQSRYRLSADASVGAGIAEQLANALRGDFGTLPGQLGPVAPFVSNAAANSAWVLLAAFVISAVLGVLLAFAVTRSAQMSGGFAWLTTMLLSVPPFFSAVGATAIVIALAWSYPPVQGHWLLPTIVLSIRPAIQIARLVSGLIGDEFGKQYVVSARSFGADGLAVRRRHIWPNIVSPALLVLASNFRLLVAEMVLIEWLLNWPGLGRLLATALIVPRRTDALAPLFLHAPLLALAFAVFALLFVLVDALSRALATAADPRLRAAAQDARR
jgi:peptide/nickel transport system permease protein